MEFPYRLCLAGGWIDQPWVSEINPGSVVVAQIEPTIRFNDRSGLATSSRKIAVKLWDNSYPGGDCTENAKLLYRTENPPGTIYNSGSQDHIGLLFPGINKLYYNGGYWPESIESATDDSTCEWLSDILNLVPLRPRPAGYDPLKVKNLNKLLIRDLGETGDMCWNAILTKDISLLGKALTNTFLLWKKILPCTVPDWVMHEMESKYLRDFPGAITSGCGGGYIIVVSEKVIEGSLKIKVRSDS